MGYLRSVEDIPRDSRQILYGPYQWLFENSLGRPQYQMSQIHFVFASTELAGRATDVQDSFAGNVAFGYVKTSRIL